MNVQAEMSCLRCGEDLELVNVGRIVCGREGSVILVCSRCRLDHHLRVTLTPAFEVLDTAMPAHYPTVCGTESGYSRHRRDGTGICEHCARAHREANARRARKALA